ncbi:hypothetical protein [Asticcacaulis benevestitus]|uniref:Uncharacterized protein n=1 Tax=Asticcacaulis benevestitus DSM 16100 = ATCC BAA-896 TaxID=1121022 RepID=V4NZV3_9CAUL|nr:hypothetical protein [Asticcacaulis benevestitus]ESQ81446.1 hypothetical protein ABENE_22025 [Asticcacaulis benevestitus DSM 16100 = ATCC BAA-896]
MQIGSSFTMPVSFNMGSSSKTSTTSDPLSQIAPSSSDTAEASLMKFLKMSPAEKLQCTWLNSHGITKEKLAAMKPEERIAIQKQMTDELQEQARQEMEKKKGATVNIVV